MKMPAFNAEASLYDATELFRTTTVQTARGSRTTVFPQVSICKIDYDTCIAGCSNQACKDSCSDAYNLCVGPVPVPYTRRYLAR